MRIEVVVKTGSSKSEISHIEGNRYEVRLHSKPYDNLANIELIGLLSEYFKCPKSFIKIHSGIHSKIKIIDILLQ